MSQTAGSKRSRRKKSRRKRMKQMMMMNMIKNNNTEFVAKGDDINNLYPFVSTSQPTADNTDPKQKNLQILAQVFSPMYSYKEQKKIRDHLRAVCEAHGIDHENLPDVPLSGPAAASVAMPADMPAAASVAMPAAASVAMPAAASVAMPAAPPPPPLQQ